MSLALLLTLVFTVVSGDISGSQTFVSGSIDISVTVYINSSTAIITMVGPATRWWGVGFGGSTMANTYAIIGKADDTNVAEQILGNHEKGTTVSPVQITLLSNVIKGDVRTMKILRSLNVQTGYNFSSVANTIDVIGGYGTSGSVYSSAVGMGGYASTKLMMSTTGGSSGSTFDRTVLYIIIGCVVLFCTVVIAAGLYIYFKKQKQRNQSNSYSRKHLLPDDDTVAIL